MAGMVSLVRAVEALNTWVGRAASWLVFGTVLACFATVYLRYAFNTNYIWLQELYVWQHAAVILLGAGYTMLMGGFVRVDIFYGRMSARRRAWVDILGTLAFLTPFVIVLWQAFETMFTNAWRADEGSPNAGGLPNWWLLVATLLVFVVMVALQGAALLARSLLVLRGREEFSPKATSH